MVFQPASLGKSAGFFGGIHLIRVYYRETEGNLSQAAHELLNDVLLRDYGISQPELSHGEQGKPYLPGGPEFNLSHSRGAVAVAVGDCPVGIDLERIRKYMDALPQRIFSREELRWFRENGELKRDFFTLWTLKESYYKLLGTGLPGFPNDTEFCRCNQEWFLRGKLCCFRVYEEKDLLITVACDEQTEVIFQRM